MSDEIKYYKNKSRNESEDIRHSHIPQYQLLGLEPQKMGSQSIPGAISVSRDRLENDLDNPRTRVPGLKQDIPNVGNIEHNWIDSSEELQDGNFIDNNDFVDIDRLNGIKQKQVEENQSLNVEENNYILIVKDKILSIGHLDKIQDLVSQLLFGESKLVNSQVSEKDIIVLKRVKIKVGVFLE